MVTGTIAGVLGSMEPFNYETVIQRMVPASKVLRTAAEILGRGWCQNVFGLKDGERITFEHLMPGTMVDALCLVGAISQAAVDLVGSTIGNNVSSDWDLPPEMLAARRSMRMAVQAIERALSGVYVAASWNDVPGRTLDEVYEVLLTVAEQEELDGR